MKYYCKMVIPGASPHPICLFWLGYEYIYTFEACISYSPKQQELFIVVSYSKVKAMSPNSKVKAVIVLT